MSHPTAPSGDAQQDLNTVVARYEEIVASERLQKNVFLVLGVAGLGFGLFKIVQQRLRLGTLETKLEAIREVGGAGPALPAPRGRYYDPEDYDRYMMPRDLRVPRLR
jgi:hypothetical protein